LQSEIPGDRNIRPGRKAFWVVVNGLSFVYPIWVPKLVAAFGSPQGVTELRLFFWALNGEMQDGSAILPALPCLENGLPIFRMEKGNPLIAQAKEF